MTTPNPLLIVTVVLLNLTACSTPPSHFATDVPQQVNTYLDNHEHGLEPSHQSRYHDEVLRLWRDKPDVAALQATKPTRIRIITAAVPTYPPALLKGHVNARVVISFIVGTDGRVEEARILESSDDRFNDSALEAMRRFTFLPAEGAHGPERDLVTFPFKFVWSPKALAANPPPSPSN